MPAPKSPDSYEAYYVSLYRILGSSSFNDERLEMPRKDEKAALTFRGRFYSYVRAREIELRGKRRIAGTDAQREECLQREAELARVRRYKAIIEGNTVVYVNRDADADEIYNILVNVEMKLAQAETQNNSQHLAIEDSMARSTDKVYEDMLLEDKDPFANYTIPQNPATPMGQTQDPKPGVSLSVIVHNTAERLRHGKIPKLSLPMSPEEQSAFLTLLRQEENLPDFTITQTDFNLILIRNEELL